MIEGPNIYSFDSRVRYSEAGEDMFLTPGALIDYFQDCSTLHTQDCGISMDYLKELGFAWIMISWQIRISKMPKLGDPVRTKTWAVSFRSFFGDRQYTLEDPAGGEYARAFGIWVLMDMVKGKPVRVPDHMDNTALILGIWKRGLYRFLNAGQPVGTEDHDIFYASIL